MASPCSNCVYKGTKWCGIICGKWWLVGLLLFVSNVWASCYSGYQDAYLCGGCYSTNDCSPSGGCPTDGINGCSPDMGCNYSSGGTCRSGNLFYFGYSKSCYCSGTNSWRVRCDAYWSGSCTSQAEADSMNCVLHPDDPSCTPQVDSTACDSYRQECESMGGEFIGSPVTSDVSETGCLSFCDMCSSESQERYRRAIATVCCGKGQVPPRNVTSCLNNSLAGSPEMSFSVFDCDSRGGFDCDCQPLDSDNSSIYQSICIDNKWPDSSAGGGSGGESSSSEGDSAASPYPEGCLECPWLDSILDTLKLEKKNTDQIVTCILTPGLCPGLFSDDSSDAAFQFDTTWLKYIRPFLDTTLRLDSAQLRAILKLDTNELKRLRLDSVQLDNDSATRQVISGGIATLDSTTDALNDTTRKWFRRIADSIGVSTDSLAAHLDSILRHIPDSVLDSIVKYQQYATDNFDSILYGTGKGFALVDSLIDSAVHYFKLSNHYDSVYRVMFSEYDSSFNYNMRDLPGRNASAIGAALGYGDTASTTLRGDLNAIRGAIERLGDTSGLGGYGSGYGDSLGRYRDSINKYYISDERFGELVDSTEAAWGVDSLDARWDSSFAAGHCAGDDCPPCSDDSCMGRITVNLLSQSDSIASELAAKLQDNVDSQRSELPTFWDSTFAELKKYSWFGSFDSTFLANIGAKIPNSNTCPEHCFVQDVNGTYAYVGYNMHLDWKLCRPIAPNVLNSLNAFDILKLLARILTVVTCLSIIMWEVSSRRGGGIGL